MEVTEKCFQIHIQVQRRVDKKIGPGDINAPGFFLIPGWGPAGTHPRGRGYPPPWGGYTKKFRQEKGPTNLFPVFGRTHPGGSGSPTLKRSVIPFPPHYGLLRKDKEESQLPTRAIQRCIVKSTRQVQRIETKP